jgi:putative tricarboxylic transport membrane protein
MTQSTSYAAVGQPPGAHAADLRAGDARLSQSANPTTEDAETPEAGILRRHAEYGVAAILMVLAALVVWDNLRTGAGWGDTGPQPGYFPMRIGAVLGLCGLAVLVQAARSQSNEMFASWQQLKRVSQVLLPLIAYVALIAPLGIYVASVIFIAAFMIVAGRYPLWKAVALAGFTNLLMFFVFEIQFKVPLPKGPLEALLGY